MNYSYNLTTRNIDSFWKKVDKRAPNECWLWTAGTDKDGYGRLTIDYADQRAHRISYLIANGRIKPDFYVLHTCDNPGCVNPGHLFEGLAATNMLDKIRKGRNGNTKLTPEQVQDIRRRFNSAKKTWGLQTKLAKEYKISISVIHNIIYGQAWTETYG